VCEGIELCNTLEAANWSDEWGGQVDVCDACGYIHCRSGGWVPHEYRVSRYRPPAYLRWQGAVAIPVEQWERWRESIARLPAAADFQPAHRDDLRRAWGRPERFELLAAEIDSTEDAAVRLDSVSKWLGVADAPVEGELVRAAAIGARIETLYIDVPDTFDRPKLEEWRPYALVDGRLAPAFGGGWMLDPAPIPDSAGL
jgi:hypothetical protein